MPVKKNVKTNKKVAKRKLSVKKNIDHPYIIGEAYFVRTVTMYHLGKLEAVFDQELVFSGCSWIPDTGKFSEALRTGNFLEQQPFGDRPVIVNRGAIIDCTPFQHQLIIVEK